jgi:hypothetical protein
MVESIVVGALVQKAAEIRGEIAGLEGRIATCKAALDHVQATLRMFDPSKDVQRIKPKRPAAMRSTYFAMGEITRRCQDALREATELVSAEDIARQAMRDKGVDQEDGKLRSDFIQRILYALHRLAQEGKTERVGTGLGARWTLRSDAALQQVVGFT